MGFRAGLIFTLLVTMAAGAAELFVEADGTGEFATIFEAIMQAADRDTITLGDGIYTGDGNRDLSNSDKPLHIRSASGDPENCILDCQGSPADLHHGFHFGIGGSKDMRPDFWGIEGITIMNGYSYSGGALHVSDGAWPGARNCIFRDNAAIDRGGAIDLSESGLEVEDCLFVGNFAAEGGAISFSYYSSFHVSGCTFIGNSAAQGGAIQFRRTNWISEMTDCTFFGNSAPAGANFYFIDDAHLNVSQSILAFGVIGSAVVCEPGCSATLACCDLFGNEGGDWTGCIADQFMIDGNINADPLFCNASEFDLTLDSASPCAPFSPPNESCDLIGAWPVACGGTATEDTSWSRLKKIMW